jgi:hypothetical protein
MTGCDWVTHWDASSERKKEQLMERQMGKHWEESWVLDWELLTDTKWEPELGFESGPKLGSSMDASWETQSHLD